MKKIIFFIVFSFSSLLYSATYQVTTGTYSAGYYLAGQQYYFQRFNGYCSAIDPYVSRAKDGSLSVYYCIGGS
ncbi:MAG: hypothetical protein PHX13_12490, partial [Thiovulaceae bacterium]|nr:hypothetical protein [Sulfurimonadaceae bacterium]